MPALSSGAASLRTEGLQERRKVDPVSLGNGLERVLHIGGHSVLGTRLMDQAPFEGVAQKGNPWEMTHFGRPPICKKSR